MNRNPHIGLNSVMPTGPSAASCIMSIPCPCPTTTDDDDEFSPRRPSMVRRNRPAPAGWASKLYAPVVVSPLSVCDTSYLKCSVPLNPYAVQVNGPEIGAE